MIVCICNAVKFNDIRLAIEKGHTDLDSFRADLFVTSDCGSCESTVCAILDFIMSEKALEEI